jgi:hypothetical protein
MRSRSKASGREGLTDVAPAARRGFAVLILRGDCQRVKVKGAMKVRRHTRPAGSSSHGEDEGHLLARGQLSCSRPLRSVVRHVALVVRVLRAALAKEVCAFSRHGCAGIG